MSGRVRWLVALPAIAVMAFLGHWGVRWGLADAYIWVATEETYKWSASRSVPEHDAWMWTSRSVERAAELSPSDPAVPDLMGVLFLARPGRPEYAELSLDQFARAVALRPTSPYSWANIAEARYRLGRTQAPFEQVMLQAWRLGPNEPETQRLLADLGLALWNEVMPQTQEAVVAAVGAAMRRNPLETLQIAERRGRLLIACAHAAGDKRLANTKWLAECAA